MNEITEYSVLFGVALLIYGCAALAINCIFKDIKVALLWTIMAIVITVSIDAAHLRKETKQLHQQLERCQP